MDINRLAEALYKSWSKETCFLAYQKDWSHKNPAFGQCAITALIVQDFFGGEILYCKHYHHYWNRLPNGEEIDLTRSQFGNEVRLCVDGNASREYILESDSAKKAKTLERYLLLKNRMNKIINKKGVYYEQ